MRTSSEYDSMSVDQLNQLIIKLTKLKDDKKYGWFDVRKALFKRAGYYVLRYNYKDMPDRFVYAGKPNPDNQNRSFLVTTPCPWSDIHNCGHYEWTSSSIASLVTHWRHMTDGERDLFKLSLKKAPPHEDSV